MPARSLADWLDYQQSLHSRDIDLGLARVGAVWQRLHPEPVKPVVLTVAGTNGKGSSVAYLDAILRAAGYRVGRYTSPHLLHYNERIVINGEPVADDVLCKAFAQIEAARGEIPLTYFEFGTLAAFLLFIAAELDVMVLEVGLGGRLDATNLLDADGVIISSIGFDHMDWLGDSLDAIAREKAGVMRAGKPAVIAQADAPAILQEIAKQVGATLLWRGTDFDAVTMADSWEWRSAGSVLSRLPLPALLGQHQLDNAAGVLALLEALKDTIPVTEDAMRKGLQDVRLAARFHLLRTEPLVVLDVAHNAEAAQVLAAAMAARTDIRSWLAVFSIYADKPVAAVMHALCELVDDWHCYPLQETRAASMTLLAETLRDTCMKATFHAHADLSDALGAALAACRPDQGIVIFGSFAVAGEALALAPGLMPVAAHSKNSR